MSSVSRHSSEKSRDDNNPSSASAAAAVGVPNSLDASIRQIQLLEEAHVNETNRHHFHHDNDDGDNDNNDMIETRATPRRFANYKDYVRASQRLLVTAATGTAATPAAADVRHVPPHNHNTRQDYNTTDEDIIAPQNKGNDNINPKQQEPQPRHCSKKRRLFVRPRLYTNGDDDDLDNTNGISHRQKQQHQKQQPLEAVAFALEHELKKLAVDGHFRDSRHRGNKRTPWYAPPRQRQRWSDNATMLQPVTHYGTLFFDLFFVAAVYNLGEMLISALPVEQENVVVSSNPEEEEEERHWLRTIIYFVGILGPIFITWETDAYYQSRYIVEDYAHRLFDTVRFGLITTAVLFIQPLEQLSDPQHCSAPLVLLYLFRIYDTFDFEYRTSLQGPRGSQGH